MSKQYRIIYADPPWSYGPTTRIAYETMSTADICALPIKDIIERDATLFMWTTATKLADAIRVVSAWGFRYVTCLVWDKQVAGGMSSHYARIRHELLLIGGRGSSKPHLDDAVGTGPNSIKMPESVVSIHKTAHSVKPEWFATEYIDKYWPEGNRIELFARRARPGWDVWGNEAPNSIELEHIV